MAKPNYNFEKRQREIAKKKQQDEKRLKKQRAKGEPAPAETNSPLSTPPSTSETGS
jgi:hypothetical protein